MNLRELTEMHQAYKPSSKFYEDARAGGPPDYWMARM